MEVNNLFSYSNKKIKLKIKSFLPFFSTDGKNCGIPEWLMTFMEALTISSPASLINFAFNWRLVKPTEKMLSTIFNFYFLTN